LTWSPTVYRRIQAVFFFFFVLFFFPSFELFIIFWSPLGLLFLVPSLLVTHRAFVLGALPPPRRKLNCFLVVTGSTSLPRCSVCEVLWTFRPVFFPSSERVVLPVKLPVIPPITPDERLVVSGVLCSHLAFSLDRLFLLFPRKDRFPSFPLPVRSSPG